MRKNNKKNIKFFFPKWERGKGFSKNRSNSSVILINGLLLVCILLSISSGLIDIVFFSGLSKSKFDFGMWQIPAAILYTAMSIGFTFGKFFCAMMLGMLRELRSRLRAAGKTWSENISKAIIPWNIVHKFLIGVSIVTAISLSVISIGNGVRMMEQNIKSMSADANTLIALNRSVNEGVTDRRDAARENISGTRNAQELARQEVDAAWGRIDQYHTELDRLQADDSLSEEDRNTAITALRNQAVSRAPRGVTARNIDYMTQTQLRSIMQQQTLANEVIDTTSTYDEAIAYDRDQIENTIRAIADKEYKTPDGTIINFINEDNTPVNIQLAISRLQSAIALWQSDTGDAGSSSKVFTLIATYIHADETAGGMGASEIMLMIIIMIFGIIQEFLIYLFTPKSNIDRKLLSQVSSYLEWSNNEEKERFLISVYTDYVGDGIINQEDYEAKCKKCVELMENTTEDVIAKYSKKRKESEKNFNDLLNEKDLEIKKKDAEIQNLTSKIKSLTTEAPKRIIKPQNEYSDEVEKRIKEVESL